MQHDEKRARSEHATQKLTAIRDREVRGREHGLHGWGAATERRWRSTLMARVFCRLGLKHCTWKIRVGRHIDQNRVQSCRGGDRRAVAFNVLQ